MLGDRGDDGGAGDPQKEHRIQSSVLWKAPAWPALGQQASPSEASSKKLPDTKLVCENRRNVSAATSEQPPGAQDPRRGSGKACSFRCWLSVPLETEMGRDLFT